MEKNKDKMLELLADRALFGLTEGEAAELENLENSFPEFKNDESFEMTTAAIILINLEIDDSLPAHLQAKLETQAGEFFDNPQKTREFSSFGKNSAADSSENVVVRDARKIAPTASIWNWKWLGLAAATACVVLATGLWLTRSRPQPEIAVEPKLVQTPETVKSPELARIPEPMNTPDSVKSPEIVKTPETEKTPESAKIPKTVITPQIGKIPESSKSPELAKIPAPGITPAPVRTPVFAGTPPPLLTAAQRREQLLASAPDVIQTNWVSAKDKKAVLGDVVWSNAQQKGYIRLRDLPALDPTQETYQLWIIDEAQNKKTPVSGGIFNVGQGSEAVIPINAQLRIVNPKSFAVSKEKAGGVVVTKPDRIVAIAKL